ncbi:sensor histidine kinase [Fimbriimonas ginsengisoli]|uniref:histidine kinase n=1 Tax=Fimbriimonas ginsengisoli Gsoil 348 TaxID=661478 RepID=A0A068NP79_FIMGI|nr:HAMP domain-containing sensor histidine kinase [Fimbriimonas ginsengisoli]AIE85251.1 sensor histidine kinase [Fimbriimonas ginsengisoli Gsoil 348]
MNPGDAVAPFDEKALDMALTRRAPSFSDVRMNGEPVRVYTRPIVNETGVVGAVQFARELREVDLLWEAQMRTLLVLLPLSVLVAAGGAYAFANRALRPIAKVTQAAAEISRSDLSRRLEVTGDDELAELSHTFNEMLGRLDRSFSELEAAYASLALAYEQQQRFTADASHELRTPLTRLKLATSAALTESKSPEEMREALAAADRAATSMTRLVQQLLTLARSDAGELGLRPEPIDLRVVVAEALEGVAGGRPVESAFSDRALMIRGDAEHLARVVANLVENAVRHTPAEGTVRVETGRTGDQAVISVRDSGEGISAGHMPHLFERFYRVEAARTRRDGGSGLGLAICKNIVEAHGGRLEIESSPGVGTTARAFFPLFSDSSPLK